MYLLLTSASRKLLALIKTTSRPSLARCELTSQVFPEIVYILTHRTGELKAIKPYKGFLSITLISNDTTKNILRGTEIIVNGMSTDDSGEQLAHGALKDDPKRTLIIPLDYLQNEPIITKPVQHNEIKPQAPPSYDIPTKTLPKLVCVCLLPKEKCTCLGATLLKKH